MADQLRAAGHSVRQRGSALSCWRWTAGVPPQLSNRGLRTGRLPSIVY